MPDGRPRQVRRRIRPSLTLGVLLLLALEPQARAQDWAVGRSAVAGAAGVTAALQPAASRVTGVVLDASGAPVPRATVTVDVAGVRAAEVTAGPDGRFALADLASGEIEVRASAPGFEEARVRVAATAGGEVRLILQPARLEDTVTVTASRSVEPLKTPESTSVLTSAVLLNAAAGMIDDALRHTPGFSLFRRSSSRVANPSTQGVTLRGLAGSGASRTLVLADGLPLNDPFGSWVYWNRVPQAAIDRVEVVRGAAGDLYGADALGGVIQVLTFDAERPRLRTTVEGASHDSVRVSAFAGGQMRGWTGSAAGEWVETDGVIVVARDERGKVDVPAQSDYRTAFGTIGYAAGPWHALGRVSVFQEARGNGTPLVVNDTSWRQFSGEGAGSAAGGAWVGRVSGGRQRYFNSFSAVSSDRSSERVTNEQRVPSSFATVSGQWVRPLGSHAVLIGGEGKRTEATVEETRYSPTGARSGPFLFGGIETTGSVFGRASLAVSDRVTVAVGLRGDFWNSEPRDPTSPRHSVRFFSPRASVSWQLRSGLAMRAAGYRANRTPTLNELHRGFRVGNIVTNGNPLLEPERLTGFEAGLLATRARASARVTGFWNLLDEAIANITLTVTPTLITRQRQNADQVRAAGLEVEADLRPYRHLTISGLAAVTASRFRHTPKQPALEGKRVPQVPFYQLGVGATYADPHTLTLSAQLRVAGAQFDDDLNEFELKAFTVVDAYASRAIGRGLHAFVAVENLADAEYDVGRTPVRTVGWPRTVRVGIRVFLP